MALRVALSRRVTLVGGKFGFLGAIGRSSNGCGYNQSPLSNSAENSIFRRHYFILPPPSQRIIYFPTSVGVHAVDNAEINDCVKRSADFAVKACNEASSDGNDGDLQFLRVLRASEKRVVDVVHYITLEALRGKARIDVYYAEVLVRGIAPSESESESESQSQSQRMTMELIKWELIDESFSYPFEEIRLSECLRKKKRREIPAAKNYIVSKWVEQMDLQCRDGDAKNWVSPGGDIGSFGMLDCDDFPPLRPENIFDRRPFANKNIVPVFDIKTYEMVYEYAMFALGTQSEKEGEHFHLEDVLWAGKSKAHDGWIYRLMMEVINEKKEVKFYYAVVKACKMNHLELIMWIKIEKPFPCPEGDRFSWPEFCQPAEEGSK